MEMCRGLKDQIEYEATGLKRLGKLRQLDMEELIRDMEFVSDNIADETSGSHGDLPPMTDEGRRAADQDQDAVRQSSKPKPISQDRASWADIYDSEHEDDTPAWGGTRAAECVAAVANESLLRGAPRAAQRLAAVADQSLQRGVGTQSAAHCEMGEVADKRLPRGANAERAGHCEASVANGSPLRGADAESCRSSGPVHESECEASALRLTTLRKKIEADMLNKTRKAFMQGRSGEKWRTSSSQWPSHWKELVHDEDGGYDMFGRRTQDGRAIIRQ